MLSLRPRNPDGSLIPENLPIMDAATARTGGRALGRGGAA